MARGVVGHPVRERRPDVLEPEPLDEELAELTTRGTSASTCRSKARVALGKRRVELTHRPDAGRRRSHDDLGVGEDADEAPRKLPGLAPVAGVEVQLPAAGLLRPELDGMAEPLEQAHDRLPASGADGVGQARDEQRDLHRGSSPATPGELLMRARR